MGTIAQKLEYLNDTRLLLKDNINKINNVLDDNSTFRSYPQELFNGYLDILNNGTDTLWSNLEKVSASGEEATLENVETAPMKMVLNGNTSQDTTSGKNLIKIVGLSSEEEKTKTVNGVTFTVNDDGTIKVEGTNSGSSRILQPVTYESAVTGEAGTYYYFANSPSQSKRLEMACFVDDKYEYPNSYGTTPWSKTATTNFTIRNIYFVINAGETVNNVYYVILTRNVDPQPYEPYTGGQPSPSPDYPQEVEVVTGENVVSVSGKNLLPFANQDFTIKGVRFYCQGGDLYIDGTSTGEITTNSSAFKDNFKFTLKAGRYSVSTVKDTRVKYIKKYSDNSNLVFFGGNSWVSGFTLDVDTEVYLGIYIANGGVNNNAKQNAMLWNYSNSSDYVPYSKTDYPISLGTLELCKIRTYKDYLFKRNGKWYKYKAIGKVVFNGSEEEWFQSGNYFRIQISNSKSGTNCRSNYFVAGNQDNQFFVYADNYLGFRYGVLNNILADWKTWLSTHNTIVYYALATPTEEEITNTTLIEQLEAISKAKSVKDKTFITQTNDELPFILDVEAIKEYEVV